VPLLAGVFYLLIITLIFYRFSFRPMAAMDLTPPYWINMGAVAITTMAGARLLFHTGNWKLLEDMHSFLQGFTLFFWAAATWWIPLLLVLGDWRHIVKRVPLAYHPAYWAIVFPLGMYTAATFQLASVLQLSFLLTIPRFFIYVALAAWIIVFAGMIANVGRRLFFPSVEAPGRNDCQTRPSPFNVCGYDKAWAANAHFQIHKPAQPNPGDCAGSPMDL
jgi:tellurite resistance protein TehA-like permease